MDFYSQNGEDCILWEVTQNIKEGTFLDIGAFDGIRFSNTYIFELAGWKGICVEAHPRYIPFLKKNRKGSIIVNAAVSNKTKKEVTFYANRLGSLSTLNKGMENHFKKYGNKIFYGFNEIKVKAMSINDILNRHNILSVDVVSIDIEGTELDALRGFDLIQYSPKIFVIESMLIKEQRKIEKFLNKFNYLCVRKIGNNYFYCKKKYYDTIKKAKISKNRIKSPHPVRDV